MTKKLDERAWRDAVRDMAKFDHWTIPHPTAFASYMRGDLVAALLNSTQGPEGWMVGPKHRDELFSMGLVGARSRYLTAYGYAVKRALKEEETEE